MLSCKAQSAIQELGQVDVLLEMVIKHLLNNPEEVKNKEWFVRLENALYLLESTYRQKKGNLISALEGGEGNA